MHSSPWANEKYIYLDQSRHSLYSFGLFSTICLTVGNVFFVWYNPGFWPYLLFVALTTFYLALSYIVGFLGREFDFDLHRKLVEKWSDRVSKASIDIYLPVCGERIDVIKNTWKHVVELRRAHPRIEVHVLDDGKSDALRDEAWSCRFNYIRRETNELKKAGNLRHAFAQTDGEFILILDADFAARSDILIELLPYMFEYPNCAIVQSPQFFDVMDHETWIGRGAAAVQELFYRLMQVNRDTFNGAICVGTNALYRRSALEPFGGTAPIAYSEDMRTSFQLISSGWRVFYVPINLAKGICPDDIKSFFTQQMRWSLGSISLFFSREFWSANITRMQRVCYLNGIMYYISTGLAVIFAPLPSLLMLVFYPEKIMWFNLLFSVPSLLFGTLFMMWWLRAPFGLHILRSRQVSYFAHLYALKDYLGGTLEEWIPTGDKQTKSAKFESFKLAYVTLCIVPQMLLLWLLVYRLCQGYEPANFILLVGFMIFNAIVTVPILKEL